MTENIGHHGHENQPDEQLHENHLDADAERRREIEEWIDSITRRPWFVAVNSLPEDRGLWVGTEDELLEELIERVGPEATLSEDFPSSASEILEPPKDVEFAMRKEQLSIMDYRQMSKKIREDYYGPGWGRSAPIMIGRGLAGRKPYHEAAAYRMTTKYRNPLAALVVEFTYHGHKFTRNNREWSGRTGKLAEQLSICYMDEVTFKGSRRNKELEEALKLEYLEDFRRFCGQMRTCAFLLKHVGVKVSWEKHVGQRVATDEKYIFTWWTIEAPRWK